MANRSMITRLRWFNVVLRGLMEAGIVAALAWWGYRTGASALTRTVLAIAAPLVVFGIWGLVDFRSAGAVAEPLRFAEELALSALASAALYQSRQHLLATVLSATALSHHALRTACGDKLLKEKP